MGGLKLGFEKRLELSRKGADDCWPWYGGRSSLGYGYTTVAGKRLPAHRAAYMALIGSIPEGLHLDHLCRNPACVNPAHLEPVTPRTNIVRGESPQAANARKTHCKRGHEIVHPSQYYINRQPYCTSRRCKICCSENNAAYKAARRAS